MRGGIDPGEIDFRPRVVAVVDIGKDVCTGDGDQSSPGAARLGGNSSEGQTPAARASPHDWPRACKGESLGRWGWGSENAWMKAICLLYYYM